MATISDKENAAAKDALDNLIGEWNLDPIEKDIGPISDGEVVESDTTYTISPSNFYKSKQSIFQTHYNVKIFKYNLKTSIFITMNEVTSYVANKKRPNSFIYKTFVGANGKLKIKQDDTSFGKSNVFEIVNHKEYDVLYMVVILIKDAEKMFKISMALSNDVSELESKLNTIYIVSGVVGGVFVIGFITCFICFCWKK
jgi:hypothetical protein